MNAGQVRSQRMAQLMRHASKVKNRDELTDYAVSHFGVSQRTAEEYVDDVITYFERVQKEKK